MVMAESMYSPCKTHHLANLALCNARKTCSQTQVSEKVNNPQEQSVKSEEKYQDLLPF